MPTPPFSQFDGHLVLVGLPGAGKSTIGRRIAKQLGRPFLDFDLEIERRTGLTVARIFEERGEPAFRSLEIELTQELVGAAPMVLAPGGGWVTNAGIMEVLRPPGRIVHLRVSPAEAVRRLAKSRIVRPLLQQADPAIRMQALWDARRHLYAAADADLNVERFTNQQLMEYLMTLARAGAPGIG